MPRSLDEYRGAFRRPKLHGAHLLGVGLGASAGSTQRRGEGEAGVGVIEQRVGRRGDVDGGAGELHGRAVIAATSESLGAHTTPRDRGLEIIAGQLLALAAHHLGLGRAILREQSAAEQCAGLGSIDAQTLRAQPVVSRAEVALRGRSIALEKIDEPGEDVGFEKALRDAELFNELSR